MDTTPHIRAAEPGDREDVLGLLNGVFSAQQRSTFSRDEKFWNWKYQENPFGRSLVTVAEMDHRIVGVDNLWPWELSFEASVIRAAQPCDSAVHTAYRGKGIFSSMRLLGLERAKARGIDLLFNYPNGNSLSVNLSLGWHYLGKIAWWVKIMKPLDVMAGRLSKAGAEPVVVDREYAIDPALIDRVESQSVYDESLIRIHRKPGFHAWRYEKHTSRSYGMVQFSSGSESTIAVFTINQKGNSREMVIVDLVGAVKNTEPVIKMTLAAGRQMGVGYVALMHNPEFATRELWKLGFIRRKLKNMVAMPLDSRLEGRVNHFSNWSLMAGMHDSI
jgi:predicted N-acetyltransferase YhbS